MHKKQVQILPVLVGKIPSGARADAATVLDSQGPSYMDVPEFNFKSYGSHTFADVHAAGVTGLTVREIINGILEHQAVFLQTYPLARNAPLLCTASGLTKVSVGPKEAPAKGGTAMSRQSTTAAQADLWGESGNNNKLPLPEVVKVVLEQAWIEMKGNKYWKAISAEDGVDSSGSHMHGPDDDSRRRLKKSSSSKNSKISPSELATDAAATSASSGGLQADDNHYELKPLPVGSDDIVLRVSDRLVLNECELDKEE